MGRDGGGRTASRKRHNFNPRARVGRDVTPFLSCRVPFEFQSTRPRGARQDNDAPKIERERISIHAPAWGATTHSAPYKAAREFQSTRPRGARPFLFRHPRQTILFQSTRPRGARHVSFSLPVSVIEFQSTRPRGARQRHFDVNGTAKMISIHAPAWGATLAFVVQILLLAISIHAPAWGATRAFSSVR